MVQTILIAGVTVVHAWFVWRVTAAMRKVQTLEARVASQCAALSLLTETSETGFAAVAREIERLSTTAPKPRRTSARRLTSAARKGHTIAQIAEVEKMSEGEVRLRLALAKQPV